MTDKSSSNQRGRLKLGEASTVDMRPASHRLRQVQLERDPALGLLSLEDRFQDTGEIARGGMGAIHRVLERTLNREVAMKVLPAERAHERQVRQRFLSEAQVTGQLAHPNIVPVYEMGVDDDGRLFFTMQLIEGRNFSDFLEEHPPETDDGVERALEVFFRVCDALSFAHARGVIHRDVKPSNIMVGDFGQVYLMDWGVARVLPAVTSAEEGSPRPRPTTLTMPAIDERGMVVGTYHYMAPEQARGRVDEVDIRTDVFSLGAVLYRIVAARPPIEGRSAADALDNAAAARVVDVRGEVQDALPRALLEVAMQAMQKEKTRRFQSVAALKGAVQEVLRGRFRFPVRRVGAGTLILEEGATGNDAYFIRRGTCRVFTRRDGKRVELKSLGPGEVFGETAVFTGQPRNASVEAVTEVDLIVVPGGFLADTMGLDGWTGAFVRTLGQRFTEGSRRLAELELDNLRADVVAEALRWLALRGERSGDGSVHLPWAELEARLTDHPGLDVSRLETLLTGAGMEIAGTGEQRRLVLAPRSSQPRA